MHRKDEIHVSQKFGLLMQKCVWFVVHSANRQTVHLPVSGICIIKPETREVQQKLKWELTPLTLSRKERDRWLIWNPHSSDRLSGFAEKQNRGSPQTGCFPRITKQIKEPVLSIKNAKTVQSVRINPLAIQIDPPEVISHDEDSYTDAPVWMTKKE